MKIKISSSRSCEKRLFTKLKNIYNDAKDPGSYGGVSRLLASAKKHGIKVGRRAVIRFLRTQDTYTLHRPVRKKFERNPIVVGDIDQQWQADLADVSEISKENNGNNFLLTVIDCFSKYAWVIPTKRKDASCMYEAFKQLFAKSAPRKPKRLQTDQGNEFLNTKVQTYLKENDVEHFFSYSDLKAAMVERFNRTLKSKMWRYFTEQGNKKYIDILDDLVSSYNNSVHRTIGMSPASVKREHVEKLWYKMFGKIASSGAIQNNQLIKNEDTVRIPAYKTPWDKGYEPNWTREEFKIKNSISNKKKVYKLEDLSKESIAGCYYPEEIQAIDNSTNPSYELEKKLKERTLSNGKREYFVKWKGWPDKFNSWITQEDFDKND